MRTVIKNIRIITGTQQVVEHGSLQFENGRITQISEADLPGDHVIDGTGKTLIPGLIDCHVHLGMEVPGGNYEAQAENPTELGARIMRQCMEFPKYGITCVRNAGTERDGDLTARNVFQKYGAAAIRILASGTPISITGGHGNLAEGFDSRDEVLKETRRKIKQGVDVIKFVVTGGMGTKYSKPGSVQYTLEELAPAASEANFCGKITMAHCTSLEGAKNAIRAGVRSIEHAQLDEETVQMMREREQNGDEIFFCPTLITRDSILRCELPEFAWLREKADPGDMERKMNAVRLCRQYGIRICASTDTNTPFVAIGDTIKEIALYTACGLTNLEALQTATRNAAELCRIDQETGTLEAGKSADFVILAGNPLDDIRNLELVEQTFCRGTCLYQRKEAGRA